MIVAAYGFGMDILGEGATSQAVGIAQAWESNHGCYTPNCYWTNYIIDLRALVFGDIFEPTVYNVFLNTPMDAARAWCKLGCTFKCVVQDVLHLSQSVHAAQFKAKADCLSAGLVCSWHGVLLCAIPGIRKCLIPLLFVCVVFTC